LPKKIEIDLLLADLALQLGNALARLLKLCGWRVWNCCLRLRAARNQTGRFGLGRTTTTAQRLRTASQETIPPDVKILARSL
jgi:hypothetical protein